MQKSTKHGILVDLPTSINHRLLDKGSKYAWPELMDEVEDLVHNLPSLTSAVAERNSQLTADQKEIEGLKWRSIVEIGMTKIILGAPKLDPKKLQEQEQEYREKLAHFVATKLIELAKSADSQGNVDDTIEADWGGALMKKALEKFRSQDWRNKQNDANKNSASQTNTTLVPKLIQFDT